MDEKSQNQMNIEEKYDYHNASGVIEIGLTNDMLFHMVMNKSHRALKGLICALKGLNPSDVRSVSVLNPIDYGYYLGKEVILDVRVELNNMEILDVELQVYYDKYWKQRSLLYLCRAFDTLEGGDEYSLLKPTTLIAITERRFIVDPGEPEFYSKYMLLNVKNHQVYSSLIRLNVLYLDQTELALKEDNQCNLVHWARVFKATTWEDLKTLVEGNPVLEEVANRMYSANIIPEEKTMIEAHERFLAQKRGAYAAGVDAGIEQGLEQAKDIIAEKDKLILELQEENKKLKEQLKNNNQE